MYSVRFGKVKNIIPQSTRNLLYNTIVSSHFDYCDVVWGNCGLTLQEKLQKLQNRSALIIINYINSFHATIKFTANYSPNSVNFLDVTINKSPQGISTNVYCKPTDTHQYLLSGSYHPKHCKEAIAYSQALYDLNPSFI